MTEKIDLIYFFGWVAGWVAGESGIKANTEFELSWVELRLSLAILATIQTGGFCPWVLQAQI